MTPFADSRYQQRAIFVYKQRKNTKESACACTDADEFRALTSNANEERRSRFESAYTRL